MATAVATAALAGSTLVGALGVTAVATPPAASSTATATGTATATSPTTAPTSVNATPLGTAQTNGTVYATAYAGGKLWVGGTFTTVRPAGVAAGGPGQRVATDLAVLDAASGAPSAISHTLANTYNGAPPVVYAVTASPDGRTVYIGGDFNAVDGVPEQHLAAFDTATGALIPAFGRVGVNGRVLAIAATSSTVYAGGAFNRAGVTARTKVAALSTTGAVLPLAATITGNGTTRQASAVYALDVSADGTHLYLGGTFDLVDAVASHGLAAVDPRTGARQVWNATVVPSGSYVTTIVHDATHELVAARDNTTAGLSRFEGVKALVPGTGAQVWFDDCYGDTFALLELKGDIYVATHAHNCAAIGGWPETTPRHWGSVYAVAAADGTLTPFLPTMSGSAQVPGSMDMPRAFATDGTSLWVGGGFTTVNGHAQEDLVRYGPGGPGAAPARPWATATAAGGVVTVTWRTVADADSRSLTYAVYKNSTSTRPLFTVTADSPFWNVRPLTVRDTTEAPGIAVQYRVRVTDGANIVFSPETATVIPLPGPH